MSSFHALPLGRSQSFEATPCGIAWNHEHGTVPHCREWGAITRAKASEMINRANNQLRDQQPARRFMINLPYNHIMGRTIFNHGVIQYVFAAEQHGLYHFRPHYTHWGLAEEVLVRESHTMALNVVVRGNKATVHTMSGAPVFQHTAGRGETLRTSELRHMVQRRLVADNMCTNVTPIKFTMNGVHSVVRGNPMIIDNRESTRARQSRAPPLRGQTVITSYFGR
jgi:hypothetical protein